jgi:ubiquinone/menaquinone biosynthesis C-methylase UbiE
LEDLTSGRTPDGQWNAARTKTLKRRPKHNVESNEVLAASNARKLFNEKYATYARFISFVRYPHGLRTFFRRSSLLLSGIRVLDAGCGTGAAMLAVHDALAQRSFLPQILHAFDLTPAMLERFEETLETQKITIVETRQANVLNLEALPKVGRTTI